MRSEAVDFEEPRLYRWTKEEYYQACEAGLFLERRVQLIDGITRTLTCPVVHL